jgi:hypothetical protein
MNDKDKKVVENFVIAGLSLESLFTCFPGFPKDEITKIYNSSHDGMFSGEESAISVNCS